MGTTTTAEAEATTPVDGVLDALTSLQHAFRRLPKLISEHVDLHPTQVAVLRSVEAGLTRVSDVADRAFLSMSAASRTVDALVDEGLLNRVEDPDNRRAVVLSLTDDGRETLARVQTMVRDMVTCAIGHLGEDRLDAIAGAMDEFATALAEHLTDRCRERDPSRAEAPTPAGAR